MNAPYNTADQVQQAAYGRLDKLNGVHNVATYVAHLEAPKTGDYRVLPDGTVEFVRKR